MGETFFKHSNIFLLNGISKSSEVYPYFFAANRVDLLFKFMFMFCNVCLVLNIHTVFGRRLNLPLKSLSSTSRVLKSVLVVADD